MPPRPPPGAVPAGRVRQLLARPPGWVPPPEAGDPVVTQPRAVDHGAVDHGIVDARALVHRALDHSAPGHSAPGHSAPGHSAPGHSAPGHSVPGHSASGESALGDSALGDSALGDSALGDSALGDSALGDSAADVPAVVALEGPGDLRELSGAGVRRTAAFFARRRSPARQDPPTEPGDRPPGLLGMLPVALRTGRLDPGRRGAAALVLVAVLAAVVAGGVVLRGRPQEVAVPQVLTSGSPVPGASVPPDGQQRKEEVEVVVAVAGKVTRPGLVRLPAGSRVADAVEAAGGLVPGAGTGLLNLARRLVDGEQVLVGVDPAPAAAGATGGDAAAGGGGLLDLNTATVADLDALPGIGPVLAQRIVDWRTANERFASVDQLREVTGIGEAKYGDLAPKVTV